MLVDLGPAELTVAIASDAGVRRVPGGTIEVIRPADPFHGRIFRPEAFIGSVDDVSVRGIPANVAAAGLVELPGPAPAAVSGWAIDRTTGLPPAAFAAREGGRWLPVIAGFPRPDVARSLAFPDASGCGFRVVILAPPAGTAHLDVFVMGDESYAHVGSCRYRAVGAPDDTSLPETATMLGSVDTVRIDADGSVTISGWCVDPIGPRLASSVVVQIGERRYDARYGEARPDVALTLGDAALSHCGFTVRYSPAPDERTAHVLATDARHTSIGRVGAPVDLASVRR